MTDEQLEIIRQPPTSRQLVTAGPGTGKTHTLIGRIAHLVQEHGVQPGSELAVLTFSRAAAREIRDRVALAGNDAGYVRAGTFDSFATRLLGEFQPDGAWLTGSYEHRIRAAVSLLKTDEAAREHIRALSHVFVDEVQDLVGARADLVLALLELTGGGFTLLGDPAQGIYNFQLQPAERIEGSARLYKQVRKCFGENLIEASLTENHRAQTPAARSALFCGPLLNARQPDYEEISDELLGVVTSLPTLGRVEDAGPRLKRFIGRTAILCCTNGQALMISRKLHEAGVAHAVQRRATDRVLPAWVARVFAGYELKQIGRERFLKQCAGILPPEEAVAGWTALVRIESRDGRTLDLDRLARRLRLGDIPDELLDQTPPPLTVSTIHRAKGLEFDRVILATHKGDFCPKEDDELPERTRQLYVALSRPRHELRHMELPGFKGVFKHDRTDRWIRKHDWKLKDIEMKGRDLHRDDPAGAFLETADPAETQRYLAEEVRPGDPVAFRLLKASESGQPRAFYAVEHRERLVGVTSEEFGDELYQVLGRDNWPQRVKGLCIDALETVAGSEVSGRAHQLGSSGLWLCPRISGLGFLSWRAA